MNLKIELKKSHKYLGLTVGMIIFIISISGSLLVFKDDIQYKLRKDYIFHNNPKFSNNSVLPLSELIKKANQKINEPLVWITVPIDKRKSYEFHYYERDFSAWNYYDEFKVHKTAYIDPFSGKILKIYNEKNDFFFIVLRLHFALLLGTTIGSWVVGISVIIFVVLIVSGIIIWLPKNKRKLRSKLWFRWNKNTKFQRKNYDLHRILGIYV